MFLFKKEMNKLRIENFKLNFETHEHEASERCVCICVCGGEGGGGKYAKYSSHGISIKYSTILVYIYN